MVWGAHGWSIELRGDELAEIRYDGRMLLRAVRAAVRDRGWLTVPVRVLSTDAESEALTLQLRHEGLGARIDSTLRVHALAGELTISWEALNAEVFHTCRTGLVVLHPASDAGRPVDVGHADGSVERSAFPRSIRPHQPIMDIRALRVDDLFEVEFAGDVFEMEDQRNWTDASFKTYSRPLGLPYPYLLDAGERVEQSLTLRLLGSAAEAAESDSALPEVVTLSEGGVFPEVGVEASTSPDPVPPSDAGAFRVVELNLTTPNWSAALDRAAADRVPLDVRLVTDGEERTLLDAVRALADVAEHPGVARLTAFDAAEHVSDAGTVAALRAALSAAGLSVPVLAGARSHFTELNREQARIARDVDGVVVNTTPLFHTLDTEQLLEAVAMQRLVAEQSVAIADGLPVHIGPVSLRPRFNNVATTAEPAPTRADLSEGYGAEFTGASDARQTAPELGAWVIASAAALAVSGVASVSWFETWGPRGLKSTAGRTAAAEAVDALIALRGGQLLTGASPDGLIWAIGSRTDTGDTVLVANLDRVARRVMVPGVGELSIDAGEWVRVSTGDRSAAR